MKSKIIRVLVLGISVMAFAVGCASSVHRGVVAMKIDEHTAHVCIDPDEAKVGDHLSVFRNECSQPIPGSKSRGIPVCKKRPVGSATIISYFNEHYAEARFANGTAFKEGDMVERTK